MNSPSAMEATSEAVARDALERSVGATLSDGQWRLYRERLVAYIQLLRSWDGNRPTPHKS